MDSYSNGEQALSAAASFKDYLAKGRHVSATEIEKAEKLRRESGGSFVSALRKTSAIGSRELVEALADYYDVPLLDAGQWNEKPAGFDTISHAFLRENKVFPIEGPGGTVLLAMEDPSDLRVVNALRLAVSRPVMACVAAIEDIQAAIERTTRRAAPARWEETEPSENSGDDVEHLRDMALGAPVVRFVNQLIEDAIHARATDIHVEPFEGRVLVRIRVDGMLRELTPPPVQMAKAIVSRIKILSALNIAERRLPQDGRARIKINDHRLDLRVATMPNIHGEAVTIRLLDNARRTLDLGFLGFSDRDQIVIRRHLTAPYGLILVTGPTGSGKTTTLATALSLLNERHRKILTIEDPIEYELEGIHQTQAKPAIGLTFAAALRSFLRHDPDVLMVGEMRDAETAGIGIHAALTGHLVLSTLHTNTAAGAVPRLLDMGVDSYLLSSALRCVIAQRLVRVLCPNCKEPDAAAGALVARDTGIGLGDRIAGSWHAVGCERCFGTGYSDRIVIAEVLDVDDEVRKLIGPGTQPGAIETLARNRGMTTMLMDGAAKCRSGLTTLQEVHRVALDN